MDTLQQTVGLRRVARNFHLLASRLEPLLHVHCQDFGGTVGLIGKVTRFLVLTAASV
jgi:hypothetical protein